MKKINEIQKEIIQFFQKQLKFWENTSDIDSPTHLGDIKEFLNQIKSDINQEKIQNLAEKLYLEIKHLGEEK